MKIARVGGAKRVSGNCFDSHRTDRNCRLISSSNHSMFYVGLLAVSLVIGPPTPVYGGDVVTVEQTAERQRAVRAFLDALRKENSSGQDIVVQAQFLEVVNNFSTTIGIEFEDIESSVKTLSGIVKRACEKMEEAEKKQKTIITKQEETYESYEISDRGTQALAAKYGVGSDRHNSAKKALKIIADENFDISIKRKKIGEDIKKLKKLKFEAEIKFLEFLDLSRRRNIKDDPKKKDFEKEAREILTNTISTFILLDGKADKTLEEQVQYEKLLQDLTERSDRLAKNMLAGSQKQRVAVARDLNKEPAVIILDEPDYGLTSGLFINLELNHLVPTNKPKRKGANQKLKLGTGHGVVLSMGKFLWKVPDNSLNWGLGFSAFYQKQDNKTVINNIGPGRFKVGGDDKAYGVIPKVFVQFPLQDKLFINADFGVGLAHRKNNIEFGFGVPTVRARGWNYALDTKLGLSYLIPGTKLCVGGHVGYSGIGRISGRGSSPDLGRTGSLNFGASLTAGLNGSSSCGPGG